MHLSKSSHTLSLTNLRVIGYSQARAIQEDIVNKVVAGRLSHQLLLAEHPPTLTVGYRCQPNFGRYSAEEWIAKGYEIVRADRGGEITLHSPGQLVLYPVINLRALGIGVRRFVEAGLGGISSTLDRYGLRCEARLSPAGVWISPPGDQLEPGVELVTGKKIASVGLRIVSGVTNHGFSVNLDCDLTPFRWFSPCGLSGQISTSLLEQAPELFRYEGVERTCDSFKQEVVRAIVCNFAEKLELKLDLE